LQKYSYCIETWEHRRWSSCFRWVDRIYLHDMG